MEPDERDVAGRGHAHYIMMGWVSESDREKWKRNGIGSGGERMAQMIPTDKIQTCVCIQSIDIPQKHNSTVSTVSV